MEEFKKSLKTLFLCSMQYGTVLGVFWIFRYIFQITTDLYEHLFYIYEILTVGTLLIYYILVNRYRDHALGGHISYRQCLSFSTLLFFFAALFESVIIYVHIAVLNPTYVSTHPQYALAVLEDFLKEIGSPVRTINVAAPIYQLFNAEMGDNAKYILNNIYVTTLYGFLLSLFYGIFVRRKSGDIMRG